MVKSMGQSNKNKTASKKRKNVIELFGHDSIDKTNILSLNDYKGSMKAKKNNHGSTEDFDESNYVNFDDYDYWDN
jgi:hypothetical protein